MKFSKGRCPIPHAGRNTSSTSICWGPLRWKAPLWRAKVPWWTSRTNGILGCIRRSVSSQSKGDDPGPLLSPGEATTRETVSSSDLLKVTQTYKVRQRVQSWWRDWSISHRREVWVSCDCLAWRRARSGAFYQCIECIKWSQVAFSAAQWQNKRQWPKSETQDVSCRHKVVLGVCEGDRAGFLGGAGIQPWRFQRPSACGTGTASG